ncbi:hypothetical protein [Streptomyces sp. CA-111067]|uniref:hypothetical protein n=1 Tax=Streptomyces sp. CA-111067 TaxID=3240046 RepID=UPI003D98ADE7
MSFNNLARAVRDEALPYDRRVTRLRSCVQLYRPIGFHATLSFLEAKAGRFSRDEGALPRALDVLESSRHAWHAELRAFDDLRRLAKGRGERRPTRAGRNPYVEMWWSGAPREGALHALSFRRDQLRTLAAGDPVAAELERCVAACLESGGLLTAEERSVLADCRRRLGDRQSPAAWSDDTMGYFRTADLLKVVRHAEVAAAFGDDLRREI